MIARSPVLLIRADAGSRIGAGHVMRCLALAQAWHDIGGRSLFAMADPPPGIVSRIRAEGAEVLPLDSDRGDVQATAFLLRQCGADYAVLDGYHLDIAHQRTLRETGARVLLIDDNGESGHYETDLVLNQNLHASAEIYCNRAPHTRLLLGPQYGLLRREFRAIQPLPIRDPTGEARRVLVTLGGGDIDNVTGRVVTALTQASLQGLEAVIVLGAANPHRAAIEMAAASCSGIVRVLQNVADMPAFMAWADVAITAAGSTCWELCYMGLPSIVIVLAENQRKVAASLAEAGVVRSLGEAHNMLNDALVDTLTMLCHTAPIRAEMAARGRTLVDGLGAVRCVAALLGKD